MSVLLRQTQVSNKVNLTCVSEKCHFCIRILVRFVHSEKWVYLGDDGAKVLVVICDYVYFSISEWIEDCGRAVAKPV